MDIGEAIQDIFDGDLEDYDGVPQDAEVWFERARVRKGLIDKYLWNEEKSLYFDYDTVKEEQSVYDTVTAFWAMWAGCASQEQAEKMT
jgi:alpha,alpha-trehalase